MQEQQGWAYCKMNKLPYNLHFVSKWIWKDTAMLNLAPQSENEE